MPLVGNYLIGRGHLIATEWQLWLDLDWIETGSIWLIPTHQPDFQFLSFYTWQLQESQQWSQRKSIEVMMFQKFPIFRWQNSSRRLSNFFLLLSVYLKTSLVWRGVVPEGLMCFLFVSALNKSAVIHKVNTYMDPGLATWTAITIALRSLVSDLEQLDNYLIGIITTVKR